ncbi:hypothetical protein OS493_027946 [Desmophyllum pertusum]|uniref:CHAT domain-containing protein n=1 Tax=Desmophyllum pertusum TaxID=174260 RepID=A0A9W9Y977_9CNID|nr:hypothetical protein OS493_027946 [Desmophyllum pertusum]
MESFDPDRWIDFENIVRKKSCTCLSFSFFEEHLLSWILKANRKVMFREVETKGSSTDILTQGLSILDWLEKLKFQLLLQGERCEDRSLFLWDEARSPSHVEESPVVGQVTEQEKEVVKEPSALKALYKIIIAPVADLLEGSEIIVVPDRSLYRVPFAALMDESGEYLSEKFRIRFIPSLATLKLIQDSPADYHSQSVY